MLKYIETISNVPGTNNTFYCEYNGTHEVYGLEIDSLSGDFDIVDEDGDSLGFDEELRNWHKKNIVECLKKL